MQLWRFSAVILYYEPSVYGLGPFDVLNGATAHDHHQPESW